ncbi:hypothetical protein AVEN_119973-1 [Araneus ventricosus]|uniref:Uncharacterized protein n=1 Tax=Araneus ventricosus TaxID=182803 RepID=A0A4Y2Q808_ARAVE|nr:hypothetical protein AVEN_119973-1 [Araneus ventricosus]
MYNNKAGGIPKEKKTSNGNPLQLCIPTVSLSDNSYHFPSSKNSLRVSLSFQFTLSHHFLRVHLFLFSYQRKKDRSRWREFPITDPAKSGTTKDESADTAAFSTRNRKLKDPISQR